MRHASLPRSSAAIILAALALAGCGDGGTSEDADREAVAANFTPPTTARPTPLPGQEHGQPLTAYVGHYPADAVSGVTFYNRTEVADALNRAVGDQAVRRQIVATNAVTTPIVLTGGRLLAHGCEPHNCGDNNWTFLVTPDGEKAEACHHNADIMGNTSRWYRGAAPETRPGDCPQGS